MRLGAHMSTRGGLPRAVERGRLIDATALQVFVKSARCWSAPPPRLDEARSFRAGLVEHDLALHTLAHASYLINLASPEGAAWRRSVAALTDELERCALFGIPYLVVHSGSHLGAGEEAGLGRVVRALDRALESARGVTLLLENTAGCGSNLGHRFEQLGWIFERVEAPPERLGMCFDTCHAVAAGYALADERSYGETMAEIDRVMGLGRLRAFHLNDSAFAAGSRRDRHAHIGHGAVGLDGFRRIVNDPRFEQLPMVLETPKGEDLAEDRINLRILRALVARPRPR